MRICRKCLGDLRYASFLEVLDRIEMKCQVCNSSVNVYLVLVKEELPPSLERRLNSVRDLYLVALAKDKREGIFFMDRSKEILDLLKRFFYSSIAY